MFRKEDLEKFEWIECNLLWLPDPELKPEYPQQIYEKIQASFPEKEALGQKINKLNTWYKRFCSKNKITYTYAYAFEKTHEELLNYNKELAEKIFCLLEAQSSYNQISTQITTQFNNSPEKIDYDQKYQIWQTNSFTGQKLNQPGTLIWLADNTIELIGSINECGGLCSCCFKLEEKPKVLRYAKLFNFSTQQES